MTPIEKAADASFYPTADMIVCVFDCEDGSKCVCQQAAIRLAITAFLDGVLEDPNTIERIADIMQLRLPGPQMVRVVVEALKSEATR